jgi:hypothetical protein
MRFDEEIEYVKAARKLKLPSVVQAYSWDNLTTKGRFHVLPDRLLVWDDLHERAAREIHHVPPERIVRTGAPFFDKWLDVPEVEPRDAFLRRVGIDNAFVLYVGSSKSIARDETTVVEGIRAALAASEDESLRNAWIVVRPHPANADSWRKLNVDHSVVWPAEARLPESDEDIGMFASSVRHALAVVGVNTSAMIDAVALDAPTAAILVDAFEGTQAGTEHFRALADAGAIAVVASAFELTGYLGRLKSGEDPTRDGRQAFLRTHLRSATASAGEAGADEIEAIATGRGM